MYINRASEKLITKMIKMFKVVLVTGPRQVGKTTLLKHVLEDDYSYVTLDDINELEVARSDPKLFFLNNSGKVVIDEVQNAPELFSEIKRIVDASNEVGKIILTGSQTFSLMNGITETLAGRVGILELNGLSLREINHDNFNSPIIPNNNYLQAERVKFSVNELWDVIHRGSMPEMNKNGTMDWQLYYAAYVKTYIERDVRMIVNVKDLNLFSKFLVALAARTSQLLNYNVIANELGTDIKTIKSWVSVLETSGLITIIQPFSNNQLSRAIKTPMLYFMDTGLVCYLLKWLSPEILKNGAMSGEILETFVVSEIVKSFKNQGFLNVPIYFYRDRDKNEIDVIVEESRTLYPIEIKKTATPRKRMGHNLSILERAEGYETGQKLIMCLVEKKMYISNDIMAYPITEL